MIQTSYNNCRLQVLGTFILTSCFILFGLYSPHAVADSDPPHWVRQIGYSFKISNLSKLSDYKFFALPDIDAPIQPIQNSFVGAGNFSEMVVLKKTDSLVVELEKNLKEPSDLLVQKLRKGSLKIRGPNFTARDFCPKEDLRHCSTFIADELIEVRDVFEIVSATENEVVIKNKAVTLVLNDNKNIDLDYDKYDPKNPRAWMKSINKFQLSGVKAFPDWTILLLRSAGDFARLGLESISYFSAKEEMAAVYAVKKSLLPAYVAAADTVFGWNFLQTLGYANGYEARKSFWDAQAIYLGGFKITPNANGTSLVEISGNSSLIPDHLSFKPSLAIENLPSIDLSAEIVDSEKQTELLKEIGLSAESKTIQALPKEAVVSKEAPAIGSEEYYVWFFGIPAIALIAIIAILFWRRNKTQ